MDEKIFDKDFFNKLTNINLNLNMKLSTGNSGTRKSRAKGTSVEFSDYREYVYGDDFRRIDWNAYGRFDKYFIKLFMEEREARFNIYIDCSKSMDFGEVKKNILALRLAGIFSYLALNNLDRVTINLMKEGKIISSENFSGKVSFERLLNYLNNVSFNGETNLKKALQSRDIKMRGVSIILSDFFSNDDFFDGLKYLAYKKQEIILIHILNSEELNPEYNGEIKLIDSETGSEKIISLTPNILREYHNKLEEFSNKLDGYCRKLGGNYIRVSSSDDLLKIVFEDLPKKNILSI